MASTAQLRQWWQSYRCIPAKYTYVAFPGVDREWRLPVAAPSADLWRVFAAVMAKHNYLFRESAGGTYNCREIGSSGKYSLHAYAIAVDLNPSKNKYGSHVTDMPLAFRNDILSIKTTRGTRAFRWGMEFEIPDPMHYDLQVPPSDTTPAQPGDDDMATYRTVRNVPEEGDGTPKAWAKDVVDDGIAAGVINITDTNPDDWEKPLTYGTMWTLLDRLKWPKGTRS